MKNLSEGKQGLSEAQRPCLGVERHEAVALEE